MDFFSREFSFTINGLALVGVGVFSVISLFTIAYYISHLLSRIRELERPKYGFLGKPVYTLAAILIMISGLGFFGYSFTQQQNFEIQAQKVVNAQIVTTVVTKGKDTSIVAFKATPFVDGSAYGNIDAYTFDIYWNIIGAQNTDKFEFGKNIAQQSGFNLTLKNGKYDIKTLIVFQGKSYSFSQKLEL
jgi:hypothetical protein